MWHDFNIALTKILLDKNSNNPVSVIVTQCPFSYYFITFTRYVLSQNSQNWTIIFTTHISYCRHRMLIHYTFMIKENNYHDIVSKFGLTIFFLLLLLFRSGEPMCTHKVAVYLVKESKWCTQISSTVITFRKFGYFWNISFYSQQGKFLLTFVL